MNYFELFNQTVDKHKLRDYLENNTLVQIENYISLFEDIPITDIDIIFEELLERLFEYDTKKRKESIDSLINKEDLLEKVKPITQIKYDIQTIQKYQDMVLRLYGAKSKIDNSYVLFNAPKEIKENYKNNKIILNDLENKSFQIISKLKYYQSQKATKNEIKEILKDIKSRYSLLTKSLDIKTLIDSL